MRVAACVAAVLLVSVAGAQQQVEQPQHDLCEPIRGPLCLQVPYNRTAMPNLLNQHKQEDAALELSKYISLMKLHCSPHLEIFLCAIFLPLCTPLERPLYPCRSLCESVVTSCSNVMQAGRYDWQPVFDCETYPDWPEMCLGENMTRSRAGGATGSAPGRGPPARASPPGRAPAVRDLGFVCPVQFKVPRSLEYSLRVGSKVEPDCGAPCHAMFFSEQQRRFARAWVGAWAALCSASCLFTVLTFLIDMQRFRYPERPIIFLSVCYLMVAATYVAGVAAGDSVACREPFPPPDGLRVQTVSTVTQGTKHELCTILFMLLYFFGMASSIWWVVLTLTWFLAAGLKWGHEAIEANSQYFHLAAWAVPAVKTITILAMGKVDGDVLSGVCYVGVLNVEALRGFVVAPLCAYLALGTVFLLAGFVALFRIRTVMKHDGTRTDKLEKLMIRIGTFSVLYTVPALIVLACLLYEQAHFDLWMESWRDDMCARRQYAMPCPPGATSPRRTHKPEFEVFMIKYLMCMIVGITSSFWTWSGKTLHSWRCFLNRIRGRKDEAYV